MLEPQIVTIDEIDSIHMIGVGGAGMSGIAKLLAQRGVAVSGSDLKPSDVVDSLSGVGRSALLRGEVGWEMCARGRSLSFAVC